MAAGGSGLFLSVELEHSTSEGFRSYSAMPPLLLCYTNRHLLAFILLNRALLGIEGVGCPRKKSIHPHVSVAYQNM